VTDRLTIASGAPADWQKVAGAALARLGQLREGKAEMVDSAISVTGLTETEEGAQRVRSALRGDVPASFRLTDSIQQDPVIRAAEEARRRAEEEARRRAEEEARRKAEEEARRQAEARARAEEEARRVAEARARAEAEAKARAESEARARTEGETRAAAEARVAAEAKARAEADARAAIDAKARAEAEARQKAEAERRAAEEAAKRAAAEAARRRADEERALAAKQAQAAQAEAAQRARILEAQRCQRDLASAVEAGSILFQRASADLDRRSHQTLNALAQIAKGCPGFEIEVAGHTDNEGEPERNQRLSERRAASVRDYLVRVGVPADALQAVGYGETRPRAPNDSPANMARNRRIELTVKPR
jgi:outer membrane protein OmpA-like peptidoglycan-associated protein